MTITTLIIIIQLSFPHEIKITFESMDECQTAINNLYFRYYKKAHRGLILPIMEAKCK